MDLKEVGMEFHNFKIEVYLQMLVSEDHLDLQVLLDLRVLLESQEAWCHMLRM